MGIEELLPGIIRLMEERFGRIGRPVTTALLFMLAMAIMAWCLGMVWDKVIAPILKFFGVELVVMNQEMGANVFLVVLGFIAMIVLFGLLVVYVASIMAVVLRTLIDRLQSSRNLVERAEIDQIRQELLEMPDLPSEMRRQLEGMSEFTPELSRFERWRLRIIARNENNDGA